MLKLTIATCNRGLTDLVTFACSSLTSVTAGSKVKTGKEQRNKVLISTPAQHCIQSLNINSNMQTYILFVLIKQERICTVEFKYV